MHYFNELDPFPAAWLRELFPGNNVDVRSIADVNGSDLSSYTRCHFFAGIGGWEYALQLAAWPREREVWTGSCPCQPFSAVGQQKGTADSRHLWPEFLRLIAQRRPATIFGEQVASRLGREWLTGVRLDLEALGYVVGAADLCAASIGPPHIRQRLWWGARLANTVQSGRAERGSGPRPGSVAGRGGIGGLADAGHEPARGCARPGQAQSGRPFSDVARRGASCRLGNTERPRLPGQSKPIVGPVHQGDGLGNTDDTGSQGWRLRSGEGAGEQLIGPSRLDGPNAGGFWSEYDLIPCTDGKARRVEPGTFPLAHGVPARVGRLRGYGNAIVPQLAAAFIKAFVAAEGDLTEV